ncbi:MAG: hypothetical protein LC777_07500 [Actinobacteria bacterium]|nr:hypothetical protein [Actinomycetota bacterium]
MDSALHQHLRAGAYDAISSAEELSHMPTMHLREICHDRHCYGSSSVTEVRSRSLS